MRPPRPTRHPGPLAPSPSSPAGEGDDLAATGDGAVVLIPVRSLDGGKRRLAGVLTPGERRLLVEAMLTDVIAAARACERVSRIVVVTDDPAAADFAERRGAAALRAGAPCGYSRSVALAVDRLRESDQSPIVVVPADVPLVDAGELAQVAAAIAVPGPIALVEAQADGGTNCIGLSAAASIDFRFGPRSFSLHMDGVRRSGRTAVRLDLPGLAFDVDWPEHLVHLAGMAETTHAARLVRRLDVPARGVLPPSRDERVLQ